MSPDDPKMTPIEPIRVALIGTDTGTGDGSPMRSGQVLVTPDHQPNLVIRVVTPIVALSIRFANAYLTALVGLVLAGMTTDALGTQDFTHLVVKCASLSLAGPAVALAKDLITILSGLERKFPLATGSV